MSDTRPADRNLDAGERDPRPVVALPRPGLPGGAIAAIAAILALLLFLLLDSRRHAKPAMHPANLNDVSAFPAPPPLVLPPELVPRPPVAIVPMMPPPPIRRPRSVEAPASRSVAMFTSPPLPPPPLVESPPPRSNEPAMVLDNGVGVAATGGGTSGSGGTVPASADATSGSDAPIRATVIGNRTTIMPTGTVIPAVLETPIDSARPGLVRAIVAEDARGFDGKRVLIPRGSRLIGEYQSDVRSGQDRVLVTWTRLIRPDGVAIRIGSPAADALGGAGIPGHVNTFFFQRFASAVLQSALQVGVNLASRPGHGSVIVGLPGNSVGTLGQDLLPASDLKPKITVRQGVVMDVFVARDLDFSGTANAQSGE